MAEKPNLDCWICGLELIYLGKNIFVCPDKECDSHQA